MNLVKVVENISKESLWLLQVFIKYCFVLYWLLKRINVTENYGFELKKVIFNNNDNKPY